jgi:CBS domain containing-hemolysin-like protein
MLLLGLLLGSGVVSAAETALFSLDKLDASQLRGERAFTSRWIVGLLDRPNDALVTVLILNNFINVAIALTVAALTGRMLRGAPTEAFTLSAIFATLGILFVGEILPKMLALGHPRLASRLLAPPLVAAEWLLAPARQGVNLALRGLYRMLRIPEASSMDDVSEEELKVMINSGEVSSVLEEDELEMIGGVFELRQMTIEEIMTPRVAVVAVPDDLSQEEMIERLRQSPFNRVLVYHGTMDEPIGFVLVKEALLEPEKPWRARLREALCVPEQMRLLDLLKALRRRRMKMAVAVDEYGGVSGIVTLQDVLEEIVGEIHEKHEPRRPAITPDGPGRWHVGGSIALDVAAKELGVAFPSRRGRTLGGFVMNALGRMPRPGDEVAHDRLRLRVTHMAGRRVQSLEAWIAAPEGPTPGAPGEGGKPS